MSMIKNILFTLAILPGMVKTYTQNLNLLDSTVYMQSTITFYGVDFSNMIDQGKLNINQLYNYYTFLRDEFDYDEFAKLMEKFRVKYYPNNIYNINVDQLKNNVSIPAEITDKLSLYDLPRFDTLAMMYVVIDVNFEEGYSTGEIIFFDTAQKKLLNTISINQKINSNPSKLPKEINKMLMDFAYAEYSQSLRKFLRNNPSLAKAKKTEEADIYKAKSVHKANSLYLYSY